MGSIYSLEKSFYSEYSAYIASFDAIGFAPEGQKRFYSLGWLTCSDPGSVSGYSSTVANCHIARVNFPTAYNMSAFSQASFAGSSPGTTIMNSQVFKVWAGGQIIKAQTGIGDWWSIDEQKILTRFPSSTP